MKFLAICLCVTTPIFLLGCDAAVPQVSLTTNLTQLEGPTSEVAQFTCVATHLPYLQWYYHHNQAERMIIAEYSISNDTHQSFPLYLTILESSDLSNDTEIVIINATQNPDTPSLGDYVSTLTVQLNQFSIDNINIGCGTLSVFNETSINLNNTNVVRLTVWNIVLTVCGPLFWLLAIFLTITGPGTMCIMIEWWHGMYICQVVVEVFLLVLTACLWIGFGATVGNMKSYHGDDFASKRDDLCMAAFVFSLLSLLWIVLAVGFVHLIPQCNVKKKTNTHSAFESEVEEDMCEFDAEQCQDDSKAKIHNNT